MTDNNTNEPETKVQKSKNETDQSSHDQAQKDTLVQDDAFLGNGADKSKETTLPESVTPEPQDDEHMHLGLIQDAPSLIDVYLAVSDDTGNLHGATDLEQEVKDFCERYKNVNKEKLENPQFLLQETKNLSNRYASVINRSEKITAGITTKYLIRLCMIFSIEKIVVRKLGLNWTDWFEENHKIMSLRSAQDYMALAKIPGIIKYAFLGKERLLEIIRVTKGSKSEDPVGDYLQDHGVVFDPACDDPQILKELKFEIDTVIAMIKIASVEQQREIDLETDVDLIRRMIGQGIKVENSIIRDLVIIKENGGDPNQYLESRYIGGGAEASIITSTKKLRSIPKLIAILKSTVDYIKENSELASQINPEQIEVLENQTSELKALMDED